MALAAGSDNAAAIASRRAAVSPVGASQPVSPGRTMSGTPPVANATTGVPHAIDSITVCPNDSWSDGITKTSAVL